MRARLRLARAPAAPHSPVAEDKTDCYLSYVHPAKVHIRAKNTEIWDAVKPFIEYLMRRTKMTKRDDSNVGVRIEMNAEDADFLHLAFCHHKLPITVEIEVDGLH